MKPASLSIIEKKSKPDRNKAIITAIVCIIAGLILSMPGLHWWRLVGIAILLVGVFQKSYRVIGEVIFGEEAIKLVIGRDTRIIPIGELDRFILFVNRKPGEIINNNSWLVSVEDKNNTLQLIQNDTLEAYTLLIDENDEMPMNKIVQHYKRSYTNFHIESSRYFIS